LEVIDNKDKTIADLQEKLDYMIRQKFASSSEKFPSNQPSLFQNTSDIEVEDEPQTETITFTRKKRGNKKLPLESLLHKFEISPNLISSINISLIGFVTAEFSFNSSTTLVIPSSLNFFVVLHPLYKAMVYLICKNILLVLLAYASFHWVLQ
jgi:uncharacterized membrane protein YjjP (DUF1212 family)